jgi:hypothetical protein
LYLGSVESGTFAQLNPTLGWISGMQVYIANDILKSIIISGCLSILFGLINGLILGSLQFSHFKDPLSSRKWVRITIFSFAIGFLIDSLLRTTIPYLSDSGQIFKAVNFFGEFLIGIIYGTLTRELIKTQYDNSVPLGTTSR